MWGPARHPEGQGCLWGGLGWLSLGTRPLQERWGRHPAGLRGRVWPAASGRRGAATARVPAVVRTRALGRSAASFRAPLRPATAALRGRSQRPSVTRRGGRPRVLARGPGGCRGMPSAACGRGVLPPDGCPRPGSCPRGSPGQRRRRFTLGTAGFVLFLCPLCTHHVRLCEGCILENKFIH